MKAIVLTLFPDFFHSPLSTSVLGRAVGKGLLAPQFVQIRDFATDGYRSVDDTPCGGGAGMVMRAVELAAATRTARELVPGAPVILLSPAGRPFDQAAARRLSTLPSLILVCGRYEGVDERFVVRHVDEEISVGDFVLSGGEPAALCLLDAIARLLPGALGNVESARDESFSAASLEYPQYTRPHEWDGMEVPPALLSGDHAAVAKWRRKAALLRTASRRPDLWARIERGRREDLLLGDASVDIDPASVAGPLGRRGSPA